MEYKGNANVEEFSGFLKGESPRCAVIVAAAFVDETLGTLLGDTKDRSFFDRIGDGRDWALLTQDEHDDLHVLRKLRNAFAHDLRVRDFDATSTADVDALKLWQTASSALPYDRVIHDPLTKLLYVVGVVAFRLQRRTKAGAKTGPLPEPSIMDITSWPPVTSH